ncbi:BppU family phage baseplate upper protein [Lactobacillus crispatus]|uniref:BppU family phage baseplate upper protein n=2 Tax=Lactobacillus crispatus TaxID=47770 RepID=UPI0018E2CA03|nr:BppU family phage baseplate upper protein [Lactobacillus crispatus]MBI1716740.1 phage capsid protein [Lactobacillus crispatus]MCT7828158.1 BppU family phage baseplate upper protein [Lactobacillus crispatus]
MSLAQIVLTTNKTTSNVGDYIRKIGQGERGQILPVIVVDATGTPYDLSDKKIVFSESKDSGKYVVDDGKASTSGKFTLTDPQNGKFSYALQDQVYPESGTAWFDIVSADGTVLDTTVSFRFVVIPSATLHVNDDNYSSTLDALQAHYQGVIKNTETQTQNLINSLTDKINQAISNGQRDVANELTDMRNQLQALHNQENGLIQSWTNDFNARKADFDKLKADWQAQSKTISDSYASKIAEINSQTQSQHDQIQAKADQQLQANQSASDAELAKIKSDAQAQHDQIEKAKNDAIAEITAQRDATINQANADFKAKIDALQTDYDAWKSTTLADFTKQLADIKTNISNDQSTLKDFDQQLDYTKQELADMAKQLDSLDLTKFVTGDQFKDAMAKKASGLKIMGLGGEYVMAVDQSDQNINGLPNGVQGLADIGVLSGALQVLADAILDKNHYTKPEVDKMVNDAKAAIMNTVNTKANASDLNNKADKSQIQSLSSQLESYKQENDNLKNENTQLTNRVQTLESKQFIAHVAHESDVASQSAPIVIVDD